MSETDAAIERYYSLKPLQFSDLVRFELKLILETEWDVEDATYALTIQLKKAVKSSTSLLLTFTRVRQLQFVPSDFLIVPMYLDIRCIQDRQWEGMNYRVSSFEQD